MDSSPPTTIRELLIQAQKPEYELGRGTFNVAYRLDGVMPELAPYVLRVRKTQMPRKEGEFARMELKPLAERLNETSALTPPYQIVTGASLGQPLLEIRHAHEITDVLDIVRREPGTSLEQWRNHFCHRNRSDCTDEEYYLDRIEGANKIMGMALKTAENGHNPFIAILDQCYRLRHGGYEPDLIHEGNILLDPDGTITLIDQLHFGCGPVGKQDINAMMEKYCATLLEGFAGTSSDHILNDPTLNAPHREAFTANYCRLEQLLGEARETVMESHKEPAKDWWYRPTIFSKVEDTKVTALSEPPHALVERLRQLNEQAVGSAQRSA